WNETTLKRKWKLDEREARLREKGLCLLRQAALMGMPGAELRYAVILLRTGEYEQGRAALYKAASPGRPPLVQAAALRALAIDSERRLRNLPEALELSKRGLAALPSGSSWRNEFSGRAERLQKKLEVWSSSNH
ncbi:MAG: hypothetical protein FWH38_08880, partial [Treponema sp.]|nr:hypothetical protein [Treponema sp.]